MAKREKGKRPTFPLSSTGVILSIVFFPIGLFVLLIASIIYLADWMCYNFGYPRPLCYIIAFIFSPIFLPLVVVSFIYEALTGDDTYSVSSKSPEEKVISSKRKTTSSEKKK